MTPITRYEYRESAGVVVGVCTCAQSVPTKGSSHGQSPFAVRQHGGHVSEEAYPTMTMSTNLSTCDTSARTLGRGDALGIYSIY
ncbi:hypothetical protein GCM10010531_26620 [Blastococcus jejuensis]|uniref:Uncharacterized protein n=1 Tax=Blastococcus jejuensis TaxID=351224 RepID=A0ABP6P9C6_9ACTN